MHIRNDDCAVPDYSCNYFSDDDISQNGRRHLGKPPSVLVYQDYSRFTLSRRVPGRHVCSIVIAQPPVDTTPPLRPLRLHAHHYRRSWDEPQRLPVLLNQLSVGDAMSPLETVVVGVVFTISLE